jgi:hypothetical protein
MLLKIWFICMFVDNCFLNWMLKYDVDNSNSDFVTFIIKVQNQYLFIKLIVFVNILNVEKKTIDNCLNFLINAFVYLEIDRSELDLFEFQTIHSWCWYSSFDIKCRIIFDDDNFMIKKKLNDNLYRI